MTRQHDIQRSGRRSPKPDAGQVLVLFALSLVVLTGIVGLALDGCSTFAQRRDEQSAADLAALAGANDYLINNNGTLAIARARSVATSNGFSDGLDGAIVSVTLDTSNGVSVRVVITAPHENSFLSVVGMRTWEVTTEATSLAGFPDHAYGASPFIFSIGAFSTDGTPQYQTATDFGETNGDVPTSPLDFAWTNFGTGNVDSSQVADIIAGRTVIDKTIAFGEYIGQQNNGNHSTLYDDVNTYLHDLDLPVAVVDSNGNFMGWATFHINSASGGADKHVNGYFLSSFESARLTVANCADNACPRYLGSYVLKLTN